MISDTRARIALSLVVKLGVAALVVLGFVTLWVAVAVGDMGLSLAVIERYETRQD